MNCPSRTEEIEDHPGWNQNPDALALDLTIRQDLNGIANLRLQREQSPTGTSDKDERLEEEIRSNQQDGTGSQCLRLADEKSRSSSLSASSSPPMSESPNPQPASMLGRWKSSMRPEKLQNKNLRNFATVFTKFAKFVGPGFMVAVAYIDPGNYSTDVSAGASTRFQLLFIVLMSNLFAVVLQSLAIRLGTVTGMNLAEHCRANLPKWLNIFMYILAEVAIIATDVAEVIGSAIAFNLLLHIPLVGGCALTLVDVLLILIFYSPSGTMRGVRLFEYFVMGLVLAVVVCFCIQLSLVTNASVGEVFHGYLPSAAIVQGSGIYLSCGILGATVMPHSLYLGSGIVQPRLKAYDEAHPGPRTVIPASPVPAEAAEDKPIYRPSIQAIRYCLKNSIVELVISLTVFALFVNSAILITAGASLSGSKEAQNADLFGIYNLLSSTIAPAAGTIFAVALLFSGTSAGIVCTIAGQLVSEGQINWTIAPWLRRLLTRSISITPSIIIAASIGREGLSAALNASQVILSVILPFVTAPLIYFTCRNKYMTVGGPNGNQTSVGEDGVVRERGLGMRNHVLVTALAVVIWIIIAVMNVALLVFVGLGKGA